MEEQRYPNELARKAAAGELFPVGPALTGDNITHEQIRQLFATTPEPVAEDTKPEENPND